VAHNLWFRSFLPLAPLLASAALVRVHAQAEPSSITWPALNGKVPSQRFRLSSKPRIDFGTAAGPDPTLLSGVVGAIRFPSGTIAVGDAGNNRVLLIHPPSPVAVIGRTGDGPGEYRIPYWLGRCGTEELGVFDAGHNSLTLVSSSGILRTSITLPPTISFDQIVLCKGEHNLFVLLVHPTNQLVGGESFVVPTVLVRLRGGTRLDTIGKAGVQEYYVGKGVNAFIDKVLGKASLVAANADLIYSCDNQNGVVTVIDTSGASTGEFRLGLNRRRVNAADWTTALSERLAVHPYARSRVRIQAVLHELRAPKEFPLIDAIRVDVFGHLWVKTYDNYSSSIATWLVVTKTGRPIAVIAMPRALDIKEVGEDYVLGVAPDNDGVQHVMLYDLIRK